MTKTKLQIMREKKGLTVEQLANIMLEPFKEVYMEFIKDYERLGTFGQESGENIDKRWNELLVNALGCSVDELVEE
ncbi:XRE family transcriptional regulator [Lactococcus garvieae]|uniref:XRE family transcriptional regulator n=1 Tax=Lactococcus garvieae TaxID=1363 RepID=UPI003854F6BF